MGGVAHCSGVEVTPRPPRVAIEAGLRGRFIERYKRFFADIETPEGEILTVHCPNPGSMKGFHRPGAAVRCSTSDDPNRKLRHTLEMMRIGRVWVGLNTVKANTVVERALQAGMPSALSGYAEIQREVPVPGAGERSRLDFRLRSRQRGDLWLEVKSVTMAEDGVALFPDSVTARGRRHVETLERLHAGGSRAALLFLVQRADCHVVAPADEIDPAYGEALRHAANAGVEVLALSARVTGSSISVERELPVKL
jgi:sugar fermentation stimulation protein A